MTDWRELQDAMQEHLDWVNDLLHRELNWQGGSWAVTQLGGDEVTLEVFHHEGELPPQNFTRGHHYYSIPPSQENLRYQVMVSLDKQALLPKDRIVITLAPDSSEATIWFEESLEQVTMENDDDDTLWERILVILHSREPDDTLITIISPDGEEVVPLGGLDD